jgi:hypothetical protein
MSDKIISSLLTLPIELVYRIFDHLNDETIICSMRNVCARVNLIVDSYHRYQVNFSNMSKFNSYHLRNICSTIRFLRKSSNSSYHFIQTLNSLYLGSKQIDDRQAQHLAAVLQQNQVMHPLCLSLTSLLTFYTDTHYIRPRI